jgi:hypothetical protein
LFRAWFHVCRFTSLKRAQQRFCRTLKKQRLHDLLDDVARASSRHDSFTVYQAVLKYTPKQPKKKIRLRLPDGPPASPDEAMDMTTEYIREIWQHGQPVRLDPQLIPGVPFSYDELVNEIAKIPVTKSVAKHCIPGICWRSNAIMLADFLFPKLQEWWGTTPFLFPAEWKAAHLTFIHKPAKPPDRLCNLRPLALLEPLGKCVLGLIAAKFSNAVHPLICKWQQLGFMPMRSPFDAIRRVIQHCASVRHLTRQQRRSVQ